MARIFVGNLPTDIKESELDDLFYKYGRIREIDIKHPARPPAFAFIAFEDRRDAEDAVRGRDGYSYDGYRLRCEVAKGDRDRRGGDRDDRDDRGRRGGGGGGGRRSEFGLVVTNLPKGCSWQDLKDFMRKAGNVIYTDVDRYGEGVVEFSNKEDMEHAIKTLDDTEFKNYSGSSYIRVRARKDEARRSRSRSRSRSKDRRRSPSHSRSRSRSRSPRSRSPSVDKDSAKKDDRDREDDRRDD